MTDTTTEGEGRLRFDPTINAGHLLTFAGFIIAGFAGWTTLDKRVVVLEEQRKAQEVRDQAQDTRSAEKFGEIRETMRDIKITLEMVRDKLEKRP
jgi:hypothetical protein